MHLARHHSSVYIVKVRTASWQEGLVIGIVNLQYLRNKRSITNVSGKEDLNMAKISRNAPCPCGSGKKYKRCCLPNEVAMVSPVIAAPSSTHPVVYGLVEEETDLDDLSNSVVDLINENRLDEAEEACMQLLREFPECVDGIERLVAVHQAKGNFARAADYAQQTIAFMREREDDFDPELITDFEKQEEDLKRRAADQHLGTYSQRPPRTAGGF